MSDAIQVVRGGSVRKGRVHGPVCIDAADLPTVASYWWYRDADGYAVTKLYAERGRGRKAKRLSMHRLICNAGAGQIVDHVDRDILNNRRANLRVCTVAQNNTNRIPTRANRTGFRGVTKKGNRYEANISANRQRRCIGKFDTAEQAAAAYDRAALDLQGAFAVTNAALTTTTEGE